jgi:hypothetical protein
MAPIISQNHPADQPPPPMRIVLPLVAAEVEDDGEGGQNLLLQPAAPHVMYVVPLSAEAASELGKRLSAPHVQVASTLEVPT